ncbi:hypothetical protein BOTBODRAFT_123565 [Botryobasidium botryosum FD-172 SS1]|uniref:Uncharacterized protein n=1 Tax=Botryobasidium botryosum (strain FD-172 SS1) TaxID=930990 RepID=A0A067NC69_BOTB1|nr:hypothetical protein BOTBODRAFT_123565 [Botryobasidium botryosum FD-172 SS1]
MSDYPYSFAHSTPRKRAPASDNESDESDDDEYDSDDGVFRYPSPTPGNEDVEERLADYTARLGEILGDEAEGGDNGLEDDEDDDDAFLYQGDDVPAAVGGYRAQLASILSEEGIELPDEDEDEEDNEDEFVYPEPNFRQSEIPPEPPSTLTSSSLPIAVPLRSAPSAPIEISPRPAGSAFLHPNISRLRSFVPQHKHNLSASSIGTQRSHIHRGNGTFTPASHFSSISRTPSIAGAEAESNSEEKREAPREAFRWTSLRALGSYVYSLRSQKASVLLGSLLVGVPTVMSANGLICVGTDIGRTFVFDFRQNLKCICGSELTAKTAGAVTALSLSLDHTFLAVGHALGHIYLYDLSNPQSPARTVEPASFKAVAAGRKEGHLPGVRITHLGFVGARHTAIVSADESGLAFYHSLGKMLFVEANDVLRILGTYPEEGPAPVPSDPQGSSSRGPSRPSVPPTVRAANDPSAPRNPRKNNAILAMASLPLGTLAHSTDSYHLVALLTPIKLVVVGLKPTPRTWFRRHRESVQDAEGPFAKWRGCLAWYPSVSPDSDKEREKDGDAEGKKKKSKAKAGEGASGTKPVLVYSWGRTLRLLRVSEEKIQKKVKDSKSGKTRTAELGKLVFEEVASWTVGADVLALQWLNINQVVVLTRTHLDVYDVRSLQRVEREAHEVPALVSAVYPSEAAPLSVLDQVDGNIPYEDVSHSVRVYKGKVFLLGKEELKVGTLYSWADRILALVDSGDFLVAMDLARAYYLGEAPGNKNGLPDDPQALRDVVGSKLRELMIASSRYVFSEDRLTDGTHVTPDNRGVDLTSLFEGLVSTCARASVALDDYDFLFDDLFERYLNNYITSIFLLQLEPFILDGTIRYVPPRITQKLIALHEDNKEFEKAERVIWHIDPECLDINQAIRLCQTHALYDALIYVYISALRDYVSPVVELLGLVRKTRQYRRERALLAEPPDDPAVVSIDETLETLVPNAYKIFDYLADILSGLAYPSKEPMPRGEAVQAQSDVYTFLFYGRSSVWPAGEGGKLVLTADEEGGDEPTYPYLRLLLRFDSEALLHALDIAFEDSYLNPESRHVNRQVIVNVILEILSSRDLPSDDMTFLRIFIARNAPKYPQFISLSPSALHGVLLGLTTDPDESTCEDRQLAVEYLLSIYTPSEPDQILHLFEEAGFFRILRSMYRQERKWAYLITAHLRDPEFALDELFPSLDNILAQTSQSGGGSLSQDVTDVVMDALDELVIVGLEHTAALIDKHMPSFHTEVLEKLGQEAEEQQLAYLRYLIEPQLLEDRDDATYPQRTSPSTRLDMASRTLYVSLLCKSDPPGVIRVLERTSAMFFDRDAVVEVCETAEVYDAVIWVLNRQEKVDEALTKLEEFDNAQAAQLARALISADDPPETVIAPILDRLTALARIGAQLCSERSYEKGLTGGLSAEDMWYRLLRSQISVAQAVSATQGENSLMPERPLRTPLTPGFPAEPLAWKTISALRSLVQESFSALMSRLSSRELSFPRLFKRLVDSSAAAHPSAKSLYTEFRIILTGMLDTYGSEGDLLIMTNRLVEHDLFETIEEYANARVKGWRMGRMACRTCAQELITRKPRTENEDITSTAVSSIAILRSGLTYHRACLPPTFA